MLVTVMERTREIGIEMAVGAGRRRMMRQSILEAGSLAGVVGPLGIAVGLAEAALIARFTDWPVIISPLLLVGPFAFAIRIGLVFGLPHARRVASLNPVGSLRHG